MITSELQGARDAEIKIEGKDKVKQQSIGDSTEHRRKDER